MSEEPTIQIVLSRRLKEAREYRGFSQEEVAHHLGVPRSAISLIEGGSRRVSAEELSKLAKLFQVTMESLTGHDRDASEPESVRMVARAAADLSATDRDEVLRFAEFLRARRTE
ncbi:MAG: helix-turn-helix transcriptional regulator [Acidobacteria bacterium]|nr:helix-turn-helix transcriptional regulator [Acidobacteriota bacterium]